MNTVQTPENSPPTLQPGDKVRVTLDGDVQWAESGVAQIAYGVAYETTIVTEAKGVSVVPAYAPTDLDRALEVLADLVADLNAAAVRCDLPEVDRPTLATEHRVRADAVMDGLVAALKATAGPAGDVYGLSPRDAASALVGAATRKRGGAVSQ